MKNHTLVLIVLLFLCSNLSAQFNYGCNGERYVLESFEIGQETILYGKNIEPDGDSTDLYMDVYFPLNDENTDVRPMIVLAHGGSFVGGDKNDMADYCEHFAKLGYVSATIDYRLLSLLNGIPDSLEAMDIAVKASHDMKAAIRWFKNSASEDNVYNIDPDMIFIGGYSAGAITALITGILDENEVTQEFLQEILVNNSGFEGNSGDPAHLVYDTEVRGILNLSGAIYDTSWIDLADPVIQSFHGDADETVPYNYDFVSFLGTPIIKLYGSSKIYERTENLSVEGELYTVPGGGHGDIYFFSNFESDRVNFTGISDTTFAEIICGTLVSNKEQEFSDLVAYPNPAQDRLYFEGITDKARVVVYDLRGRLVTQKVLHENDFLSLDQQEPGMYYYRISANNQMTAGSFIIVR